MEVKLNIVAIVQARTTSTRYPNKVLKIINKLTVIELLIKRLEKSKLISQILVAIPKGKENQKLKNHLSLKRINYFQGNEEDVLDRYYNAAKFVKADTIIRITGDCPLIDAKLVDKMLDVYNTKNVDYLSNIDPPTYPDGLDIEIFTFSALETCWKKAKTKFDREHVTPFIRRKSFYRKYNFESKIDLSNIRITLDEKEDYKVIKSVFKEFYPKIDFSWEEIVNLYNEKKYNLFTNNFLNRNEGADMSKGQKLWKRAKTIIPGGNMLLTKRPEMFLPDKWPSYFSKTKGCNVWDLDNKKYIDFCYMGVGTNILGYSNSKVDNAVKNAINKGNICTLNAPEEVHLAEKLIELHPWFDMVRFARTGGEANSIAVRIARAASGKEKVAICGYHGWHDWYLSANLGQNKGLDGHLLPGLEPKGVPRKLKNTTIPFEYGDIEKLQNIISNNDIGVIKMEVCRNEEPNIQFLSKVRELSESKNIILIFDECTSGFRETLGGLHKKINIYPDMTVLGKAIGNGYAITSVLGKKEIMEYAQSTFISSTFWTEKIGSVAANATIKEMEKLESWKIITAKGKSIIKKWLYLSKKHNLDISIKGIPSLCSFFIKSENWLKYKTLITQEMLKSGILANNVVYSSIAHDTYSTNLYFRELDKVFEKIKYCEEDKKLVDKFLTNEVCHSGFKRLN